MTNCDKLRYLNIAVCDGSTGRFMANCDNCDNCDRKMKISQARGESIESKKVYIRTFFLSLLSHSLPGMMKNFINFLSQLSQFRSSLLSWLYRPV